MVGVFKRLSLFPTILLKSNKYWYLNFKCYKEMAHSRFEYVRKFENEEKLLPSTWIVVRIDGHAFHKFSKTHNFEKPNDIRAINLMNRAATTVMKKFKDIVIAFGQSDEYSFVFRKTTELYNRRGPKIMSYVNSLFTSAYVMYWKEYFKETELEYPPCFDSRVVLYPSDEILKDYLSWRQADTHINNLYNTTFWALVLKGGLTNQQAEETLRGTVAGDKNEILFSKFGINYNNEPEMFRKGTILLRKIIKNPINNLENVQVIFSFHVDLIGDKFWRENEEILNNKTSGFLKWNEELPHLVLSQLSL